jgi:hypothetical protein
MITRRALIAAGLFLLGVAAWCGDPSTAIRQEKLMEHVRTLASDAFEGRQSGEGARKAREYVAAGFARAGLKPAGTDGWYQPIPRETSEKGVAKEVEKAKKGEKDPDTGPRGWNVLGLRPGSDPRLKDEVVILAAHHDHLGKRGDAIFHGADDNATGVAALLEAARVLSEEKLSTKRSILFISFDQEEAGLAGSYHFAAHPTVPLKDIACMIDMDMLGRNMGDFIVGWVFVIGSEFSPALRRIVGEAGRGIDLKAGCVGTDIIGIRGDYGAFMDRRIPYLMFSTSEHMDYHRPTDTADRILYGKLLLCSRIAFRTLLAVADAAERPAFADPRPDTGEARVLADIVDQTMGKSKELGLQKEEVLVLSLLRSRVREVLEKGEVTAEDREELLGVTKQILDLFRGKR